MSTGMTNFGPNWARVASNGTIFWGFIPFQYMYILDEMISKQIANGMAEDYKARKLKILV